MNPSYLDYKVRGQQRIALIDAAFSAAVLGLLPLTAYGVSFLARSCVPSAKLATYALLAWSGTSGLLLFAIYCVVLSLTLRRVAIRAGFLTVFLLASAIALPNLDFGSEDRWKEKRATAELRTLAR